MKKGISLVALVITIIVLIILTGTVILTMTNGNIIGKSKETVFKNNLATYQEVFTQEVLKRQLENQGAFNRTTINATSNGTGDSDIRTWIPGITEQWASKLEISNGKLIFVGENEEEIDWATSTMGESAIKVSVIGSSADWEIWDVKNGLEPVYKKGLPFSEIIEMCVDGEKFEKPIVPDVIYTDEEKGQLETYILGLEYAFNNFKSVMEDEENEQLFEDYGEQLFSHLKLVSDWYEGGKVGEKPVLDEATIDNNAILIGNLPKFENGMEFLDINNGFMPKNESIVKTILENKPGISESCIQTSVTIPNKIRYSDGTIVNITEVGPYTFTKPYQNSITEVIISEGITIVDIGNSDLNINTIYLPSTLTQINYYHGNNNNLTLNINQNMSQNPLASSAPWDKRYGTLTVNWNDGTKTYVNGVEQ